MMSVLSQLLMSMGTTKPFNFIAQNESPQRWFGSLDLLGTSYACFKQHKLIKHTLIVLRFIVIKMMIIIIMQPG
jgi:hypothetical protein